MSRGPITNPSNPAHPFRVCAECSKGRYPSDATEMRSRLESQRYTLDDAVLTIHLCQSEEDNTVTMVCGAHYTQHGVYLSPMQAPSPPPITTPIELPSDDDLTWHEALLAALDRNTRAIVDALNDLAWRIDQNLGRKQ